RSSRRWPTPPPSSATTRTTRSWASACSRTIATRARATATACSWPAPSTPPATASTATRWSATGDSRRPSGSRDAEPASVPLHQRPFVAAKRVRRRRVVLLARPALPEEARPVFLRVHVAVRGRRGVRARLPGAGRVVALELVDRRAGLLPVELAAPGQPAGGDHEPGPGGEASPRFR